MQKKLIALAIASAMAAPAAFADVTISGKLDVSYNFLDTDQTAASTFDGDTMGISSNSSKLVFAGSEDLGGGLKANFYVDNDIDMDGGNAAWATRNTWVGLSGGWGEVRMGRHDTPFKIAGRKTDLYESEQLGENRIVFNQTTSTVAVTAGGVTTTVLRGGAGYDNRAAQALAYLTPSFSGFSGAIAYVPEEGTKDGDAWSAAAFYSNGPLFLTLAYEQFNDGNFGGTAFTAAGRSPDDQSAWRFGGSYTFGDFKVSGLYQNGNDEAGVSGADHDAWWLGGKYSFGNNDLMLTYGESDRSDIGGSGDEFDVWTLGLNHNFSKRTMLYARYAALDNDSAAAYTINSAGFDGGANNSGGTARTGGDSNGFSVGVRHNF